MDSSAREPQRNKEQSIFCQNDRETILHHSRDGQADWPLKGQDQIRDRGREYPLSENLKRILV